MALATSDPPINVTLTRRRHTVEEYNRLTALGFYDGERLELLFGEIVEKSMPQRPAHATAVDLAAEVCRCIFAAGYRVRVRLPLALTGSQSVPEPDIAVVQGGPRDSTDSHPTTAALVIEVSDTTLEADQTTKALAYARGGITDYWVVNINERTLEVRRQPGASGYRSLQTLGEQDSVAPLIAPGQPALAADLLP
jgi:Uma2 family endonuclease